MNPEENLADLADFMLELDGAFKAEPKQRHTAARPAAEPSIAIRWKPHSIRLHTLQQRCANCSEQYTSIIGLFLVSQVAGGKALRHIPLAVSVRPPVEYHTLPRLTQATAEIVQACPACFSHEGE